MTARQLTIFGNYLPWSPKIDEFPKLHYLKQKNLKRLRQAYMIFPFMVLFYPHSVSI